MASASEFSFEVLEPLPAPVAHAAPGPPGPAQGLTAAEVLAHAHAEAEQIKLAARERGYEEGFASGHEQALTEAAYGASALAQARTALQFEAAEAATRLEVEAVELALSIAHKVVAGALAVRPEFVVDTVRHALRGIVDRERITVLVNPADLPLVSGAMAALQAEMGGMEHWEVQAERRVDRGGAIVRHVHGDVDAQIEGKLERAREVVEAALGDDS